MLKTRLKDLGQEETYPLFQDFEKMVLEKNKVMNLTAITDPEEFEIKHFLDSLSLMDLEEVRGAKRILDLGTGPGFPGIPLRIVSKADQVDLMDSLNKRVVFLNEAISALGLDHCRAIHGRAEEMGNKEEYREKYDLVVSRAVANLATLAEYCLAFVEPGGYMVAMKGPGIEEEVAQGELAIEEMGGRLVNILSVDLGEDLDHNLVLIEKLKKTPKGYPRAGGKPRKNPLGQ